jgi:site-specific DNA-methyltransferase (adenine-specific)
MITIEENIYNKMPDEIKQCFNKLPNYGSDEVVSLFPNTSKGGYPKLAKEFTGKSNITLRTEERETRINTDSGSVSRFFYCAKASKSERNKGCEELEDRLGGNDRRNGDIPQLKPTKNHHPTVKPIALMEYLVKLVSREGSVILDPFMGSGTTAIACINTNRKYICIEKDEGYFKIGQERINKWLHDNQSVDEMF